MCRRAVEVRYHHALCSSLQTLQTKASDTSVLQGLQRSQVLHTVVQLNNVCVASADACSELCKALYLRGRPCRPFRPCHPCKAPLPQSVWSFHERKQGKLSWGCFHGDAFMGMLSWGCLHRDAFIGMLSWGCFHRDAFILMLSFGSWKR
jgi:hypothetical protein